MSVTHRLKQGFLRLPKAKKAILLSSGALMIASFLPWYDNRNTFGIGDIFLGIQGPLFLVGILTAAFGAVSFFNLFLPMMGKNFFKLRRKCGAVSAMLGLQALFLLIIANSVFYHPSFSANVSQKGTRFGMLTAFISIVVMVIAGWIAHKKESSGEYEDIEDIMTNPEPFIEKHDVAPTPIATSQPVSDYVPVTNTTPLRPSVNRPAYSRPVGAYQGGSNTASVAGADPLTLDAKTRYKIMKQKERESQSSRSNLWSQARQSNGENQKHRIDL